jgi:hypothetical protein
MRVSRRSLTVVVLLFLDVRVEVGKTPADADAPRQATAPAPSAQAPRATARPSTTPRQPKGPTKAQRRPAARRFAWAPTAGASGYRVELFRGNTRVFSARTSKPQITIPATWTLHGRRQTLRTGDYRWIVWPVVAGRQASTATVQASLSIPG